ncbi:hypothetical protein GG681_11900 [Epibacterium sp. SM1969]|uniref:DUF2946 domain-containing protein n=2 Tax=Tritonibacter aquimaris TaxID=2663379 RepID=A0A844AU47_9RHOB|nr:hypothetical protein [Tritonibacter aquimaris]
MLSVTLMGQGAAAGMVMPDAAGRMVICTGDGVISIYVDADGQPTAPDHVCPDCVVMSASLLMPALLEWRAPQSTARNAPILVRSFCTTWLAPSSSARAPPVSLLISSLITV